MISLIIGVLGLGGCAAAWMADADRFFHAYLTAFVFWTTLALGGLFFTMLHHLTSARWSVVLRRISESLMMPLVWLVIAFVPLMLGAHSLYHWTDVEAVAHDPMLQAKSGFLNGGFFFGRTLFFFAVWTVLAIVLRKRSLLQDKSPERDHFPGMRKISAGGMLLFAMTLTLASFDWLMSLNPHWFSTIFGVYLFGGVFLAGLSSLALISVFLRRNGVLTKIVTVEHYHDLGKLMFAFVIFWAYIGFSQYFVIWMGNLPEETTWYLARWEGSWRTVSLVLLFGHFAIPFVGLIFHNVKRRPTLMAVAAIWLLVMHWVDLYWLVYPTFSPSGAVLGWIELMPMVGLGGLFVFIFWRSLSAEPLVPVGDPWLGDSIRFENR